MSSNDKISSCLTAYRRKVQLIRYYVLSRVANQWVSYSRKAVDRLVLWPPFDDLKDMEELKGLQLYISHYLGQLEIYVDYYVQCDGLLVRHTCDTSGGYIGIEGVVDLASAKRSQQLARYCVVWKMHRKVRLISVRPQYYYVGRQEGHFFTNEWIRLTSDVYHSQRTLPERKVCFPKLSVETCAVLGTGPSLEDFMTESEHWDIWIAANFLVCDEVISHLGTPFAICVADSKLFSPLSSVQPLWSRVFEFLRETQSLFITTYDFAAYIELNFPEDLKTRCYFVKTLGHDTLNFRTNFDLRNMQITPYGNVLIDIMLPVATAVSKSIMLYGCDGVPPGGQGNFPKYSSLKSYDEAQAKESEGIITQGWYDAYFSRHSQYTRHVVDECQKAGSKISLRRPSWNRGLCDLPVLGDILT